MSQIIDLYKIDLTRLTNPELALDKKKERKKIDNLLCFGLSGLDICDYLYGRSWACWIGNLL